MSTREYKNYKGLKKQNLRDNMSDTELVLNMLAEASTRDISKAEQPEGLKENRQVAKAGGGIAGNARKELEERTGKKVISPKTATELGTIIPKLLNPDNGNR